MSGTALDAQSDPLVPSTESVVKVSGCLRLDDLVKVECFFFNSSNKISQRDEASLLVQVKVFYYYPCK